MLDINYYRESENRAKTILPTWVISKKYNLEIFEKEGFPIRINNIQQTRQIFDTMQESRFMSFMDELNGFSAQDLSIFVEACVKNIQFQENYFPTHKSIIPFDTLLIAFTIFKKISGLKPKAKRILEIGPGTGGISYYLKNLSSLKEYTYTDACESFYLLQNNVNFFLFKDKFKQKVIEKYDNTCYMDDNNTKYTQGGLEEQFFIDKYKKNDFTCNAYPWWKLGELNKNSSKYDIITSNANLLEFSEGALNDYLSIMFNTLKKDGMIFVQCLGYSLLRDSKYLFEKLKKYNFAVYFFTVGQTSYNGHKTKENMEKTFILPNMVLIKKGHPSYEKFKNGPNFPVQLSNNLAVNEVFFPELDSTKKIFKKEEIKNIVIKKLKALNE